MTKLIAQARPNSQFLTHEKFFHSFDGNENCNICNLQESNTLQHVVLHCKICRSHTLMTQFLSQDMTANQFWSKLLSPCSIDEAKNLHHRISQTLRKRKFILEE